MKCQICKKNFKHLGSHVWHKHKMFARDYKMKFGLDLNFSLMDDEVKEKKRMPWNDPAKRKKMLANIQNENSKKYQFKKGIGGKRHYFSRQSIERFMDNINQYHEEKKENCPVCNLATKHLPSHLFNKHGLVIADKSKL